MRPSLLPRIAAALLAVQLPVAVAAALVHDDESGDDPSTDVVGETTETTAPPATDGATDAVLAQAAERTAAATHYRYEMAMEFGAPGVAGFGGVLATGTHAGDRDQFLLDQAALFDQIGVPPAGDLTMEVITEPTVQYIRAPLFAALDAEDGSEGSPPEMQALVELGDRWGRIDLAAVGAASGVPDGLMGQSQLDPGTTVEILRSAAGTAEPAGTGEARGVAVTDYAATISFAELSGGTMDLDAIQSFMPGLPERFDDEEFDRIFEAMLDAPLELSVSVDGDGYVRAMTMDMSKMFLAVGEALGEDTRDLSSLTLKNSIEFYDYGDPSIVVEPPPTEDTVDLTSWALEMADAFS